MRRPSSSRNTRSWLASHNSIADNVSRYRERVGGLAEPFRGGDRDDVVVAIHEAERQLRSAERSLSRALRAVR